MFVEIFEAMSSSTSSPMSMRSALAFLRRIAMRVSSSGGWTSVVRPDLKRLRMRSANVVSFSGG